jgi:alkyl hydroperoxide reductase subunit AhpF
MSLVEAVLMAGTGDSGLSDGSRTLVRTHVSGPVEIVVFVTPTCPHCPHMVTLAHRLAVESPHVRAVCVDATEFLDRSRRYRVTGVPKTVINDTVEILGAVPEDEFIRQVVHLFEPLPSE